MKLSEENLALRISRLLYDRKAEDLVALRVAQLTVLTDYLVIATGRNALHVRGLADHLEQQLAQEGLIPRRVEGRTDAAWLVMDYQNVIVHLFKPDARAYYRLERLWDDGRNRIELPFEELLEA
ncbi:MAG: ribosome silencing factor [Clostridiales bacterium]|nr:ribosome silencing factor [Clostridiales bacterium]